MKNLSRLYSPIMGRDIDPMSEIIITVGAYGSLFAVIQAYIEPGDEVRFAVTDSIKRKEYL